MAARTFFPTSHSKSTHAVHCMTKALVCYLMAEASSSIMLLIPRDQIRLRNPNNLMRNSSIIVLDYSLPILVPLPLGDQGNPEVIVNTTKRQPVYFISR
jgi:hypothetical protein